MQCNPADMWKYKNNEIYDVINLKTQIETCSIKFRSVFWNMKQCIPSLHFVKPKRTSSSVLGLFILVHVLILSFLFGIFD